MNEVWTPTSIFEHCANAGIEVKDFLKIGEEAKALDPVMTHSLIWSMVYDLLESENLPTQFTTTIVEGVEQINENRKEEGCVDCDNCMFRSELCSCSLSDNEDDCPIY